MSAPPSSKRMRISGEAGEEKAIGDGGADAAAESDCGADSSSSAAAAPPAVLRPISDASLVAAAADAIAVPEPAHHAEEGSPFVEAIPCILMVAGPGDGTSVLAVFWDRHSERLGEEGFMRHFDTDEARVLRLVCREFRETVDATAWNDLETRISGSLANWRASFPNAIAANVSKREDLVDDDFVLFRGFHALDVSRGWEQRNLDLAITDAAFVHMRGIRRLLMNFCGGAAITDAIFANLRGIEELDMHDCDQAAITPAGFEQLRGIEALSVDESKHPLFAAIHACDTPEAIRLIDAVEAVWINATGLWQKWGPLHFASYSGLDAIVLRLLERGANPNAKDCDMHSPLHKACKHGRDSTVRLLIEWGADVNQRASNGQTAIQNTFDATLKALLRFHGATD